jgi:uridine phosphorylase
MAQDPEREEEQPDEGSVDPSAALDMVTLFSSSAVDAEMEASNIHGMLQASGIASAIVGTSMIPSLEFQVQVPRENLEEAERLVEEACAAGPEAAAEAELASEEGPDRQ